jgi:hypothetical protein
LDIFRPGIVLESHVLASHGCASLPRWPASIMDDDKLQIHIVTRSEGQPVPAMLGMSNEDMRGQVFRGPDVENCFQTDPICNVWSPGDSLSND